MFMQPCSIMTSCQSGCPAHHAHCEAEQLLFFYPRQSKFHALISLKEAMYDQELDFVFLCPCASTLRHVAGRLCTCPPSQHYQS